MLSAEMVYLSEGEKNVHTLESWGLVASAKILAIPFQNQSAS